MRLLSDKIGKIELSLLFMAALYSSVSALFGSILPLISNFAFLDNIRNISFFSDRTEQITLNEQERADLVKPSIVQVVQHAEGEILVPEIELDISSTTPNILISTSTPISLSTNTTTTTDYFPVDISISANGFIINPNGYIFTNAAVVSTSTVYSIAARKAAEAKLYNEALKLTAKDFENYIQNKTSADKLKRELEKIILEKGTFSISSKLFVINPSSPGKGPEEREENGLPAEIIWANSEFKQDKKDIALVKINQSNLPASLLGSKIDISVGTAVIIAGFKTIPEDNTKDYTLLPELIEKRGIIAAVADSPDGTYRIINTDIPISPGFGGSPLIGPKGEILGIITPEDKEINPVVQDKQMDTHGRAITIETLQEILAQNSIQNIPGNYVQHFKLGVKLFKKRSCQKALEEFSLAKQSNPSFPVDKYLNYYISTCNSLVAAGKSIDTTIDRIRIYIQELPREAWVFIGAGAVFLIVLILIFIIILSIKKKKGDVVLNELEQEFSQGSGVLASLSPEAKKKLWESIREKQSPDAPTINTTPLIPEQKPSPAFVQAAQKTITKGAFSTKEVYGESQKYTPPPQLIEYIQTTRKAGFKDKDIIEALRRVGWREDVIRSAINQLDSQSKNS